MFVSQISKAILLAAIFGGGAVAHADLLDSAKIHCDGAVNNSHEEGRMDVTIVKTGDTYEVNGENAGQNKAPSDSGTLALNSFAVEDIFDWGSGVKLSLKADGTGAFKIRYRNPNIIENGGGLHEQDSGTLSNCTALQQ